MNVLYCCCNSSNNSHREEVYYMSNEDKTVYSWDKDRLDPADFEFVDRCGEILIKTNGHVNGQQFTIDKCRDCCILILDYTASVTIDDCKHCLIVTGPSKASVFLRNCENCSIFAPCTQFRTRDCTNIDVFLFCITKPIIEASKSIRFRSLAMYYDAIEEHACKAFKNVFVNSWNAVFDFTPSNSSNFEICELSYKSIAKIDLLNSLGKVKLDYESSFFPVISILKDGDQVSLLIYIQMKAETDEVFTKKTLKLTRHLQSKGIRIFSLKQYHNKKSVPLPSMLMPLLNSASFIVIEINGETSILETAIRSQADFCILLTDGTVRLTKKYLHNLEP